MPRSTLSSGLLLVSVGLFLAATACRPWTGYCDERGNCDCFGENECFIACGAASCDVSCAQTAEACGVVCDDDCTFECNDTNHCSSYSGANSNIDCHSVPSCASECGPDCLYDCSDVSECTVQVGENSQVDCSQTALCDVTCEDDCSVTCDNVSRCEVECDGPCEVELTCNQVSDCDFTCPPGLSHTGSGSGTHRCE